jgi:hypothetical protein
VSKHFIYVPHLIKNPMLDSLYDLVEHHNTVPEGHIGTNLEGVMINLSHWMSSGFLVDGVECGGNVYQTDSDKVATLFVMSGGFIDEVPVDFRSCEWDMIKQYNSD